VKIQGLNVPRHLVLASREIGVTERKGDHLHNPRILEYHDTTTLGDWGRSRDETPWCSSFINWSMVEAGKEGTDNALARSWIRWGRPSNYELGSVVVIKRRRPGSDRRTGSRGGYHVGFLMWHSGARITLVSGNTRDSVRLSSYSLKKWDVKAVRMPA
jgi:uncharacterized protein (TIGR02594 family)